MIPAITLEELFVWNQEASNFWKGFLEDNQAILALHCGIGGATDVQAFVRHVWTVELRWAQRLTGLVESPREAVPPGPLDALFDMHLEAVQLFGGLLANPEHNWDATYTLDVNWLPPHARTSTHRKILAHALLHSQRHWAQLATLVRAAGFPSGFHGDLLLSFALV
jgi:uncharacterized damage-inducible protein DinB